MRPRTYRTSTGRLVAHDQGAHLAEWHVGDSAVIWVSQQTEYAEGRAIRGGVPICWPWFGPGRSGDLRPGHGFARVAPWQLVRDRSVEGQRADLLWELTHRDVVGLPGVEHFPHAFTARLQVVVAESATISLTVRNDDSEVFDYEAALHTYLHVGDIRRARISGLDGVTYWDKVQLSKATQLGDLTFTGETDRVHDSAGSVTVHDPALARTLTIDKTGSPTTVVWNPWVQKAAEIADFGDDEWTEMVCVEAAATGSGAVLLRPGAEHTLSTTVTVAHPMSHDGCRQHHRHRRRT